MTYMRSLIDNANSKTFFDELKQLIYAHSQQ